MAPQGQSPPPSQAGGSPGGQPQEPPPQKPLPQQHVVRRTRIGGVWVASVGFAVVLLLLLIFILENSHAVDVSFFGAHAHVPLGVALLLAAVFGVLLVVVPGTARIIQLRITARRHRTADSRRLLAGKQAPPGKT